MSGPKLEGEVRIDTSSVKNSINEIVAKLNEFSQTITNITGTLVKLDDTIKKSSSGLKSQANAINSNKKATDDAAKSVAQLSKVEDDNILRVAKATTQLRAFEQILRKKTVAGTEQNRVLSESRRILSEYEQNLGRAGGNAGKLKESQVSLKVGVDNLNRSLNDMIKSTTNTTDASASQVKAMGSAEISAMRLEDRIRGSALAADMQATSISTVRGALGEYSGVIKNAESSTLQIAQAQKKLKVELETVSLAVKKSNREFRGQQIDSFNEKFRNLTTSVQFALGPLNGVASRLVALSRLFNRNTFAIAMSLAGFTAYTVGLKKALEQGKDAEVQMVQLEAITRSLGDSSVFTATRIHEMGTEIASATLTSANEARAAASIIIQSADLTEDQLKRTIITAQGMSDLYGGDLRSNARLVARAMAEPSKAAAQFRRKGINLNDTVLETVRALSVQGDSLGVTDTLLNALSPSYDAAIAGAKTYAGALDAVSDNTKYLFEQLTGQGGALGAVTEQTNRFAQTIKDLADSDDIKNVAKSFEGFINTIGNVVNFLVKNLESVMIIALAIAASTLPILIAGLVRVSAAMLTVGNTGKITTLALLKMATASTVAAGALSRTAAIWALATGPIGALVVGLGAAYYAYRKITGARRDSLPSMDQELERIGKLIEAQKNLTRARRGGFAAELADIREQKEHLEEERDRLSAVAADTAKRVQDSSSGSSAGIRLLLGMRKADMSASRQAAAEHAKVVAEMEKVESGIKNLEQQYKNLEATIRGAGSEAVDSFGNLKSNLDGVVESVNPLERQLILAQEAAGAFAANFSKIMEIEGDLTPESIMLYEATMKALNDRVKDLQDRLAGVGKGAKKAAADSASAFKTLSDSVKDSTNEINIMMDALTGSNSANPLYEFEKSFESLSEAVSKLTDQDMNNLITKLQAHGVTVDISKGKQEGLVAAMREHTLNADQAAAATSRFTQAQSDLNSHFAQSAPQLDQIADKYQKLIIDALQFGTDGDVSLLEGQWAAEEAAFNRHTSEMLRIGQIGGFSEMERLEMQYASVREFLDKEYAGQQEQLAIHVAELDRIFNMNQTFLNWQEGLGTTTKIMGQAMDTMKAMGKENSAAYKRMASAMAIIQGAQAVLSVWADQNLNTYAKVAMSGFVGAQVGAQISTIQNAPAYATGGFVSGKGSGTSDSIPAWLSKGEFVLQAEAVKRLGIDTLNALNSGATVEHSNMSAPQVPISTKPQKRFSTGGIVGSVANKHSFNSQQDDMQGEPSTGGITIINVLDPSVVDEYISGAQGEKVILNTIRRNSGAVKQAVA